MRRKFILRKKRLSAEEEKMAYIYVKQCVHCLRVKKFQDFKPMPDEVQRAINSGDIDIHLVTCPDCDPGSSNKLLPVSEK